MKKNIILVSKDAFGAFNLPAYGNKYWNTPNINKLIEEGTLFERHYTSAPSTGMAMTSMFTGKYPYELNDRRKYKPVKAYSGETIFSILRKRGYTCHIIWDKCFESYARPYANCFDEKNGTTFYDLDIREAVGGHKKTKQLIKRDDEKTNIATNLIKNTVRKITENHDKSFIWIHLPHVIAGRCGYGGDIDLLDKFIGWLMNKFQDSSIYLTGDHGHMNLSKGIIGYGWDPGEYAIRVPLITPRINDQKVIDYPTSHVDLLKIITENEITKRDNIIVDCQYFAQPHRKLAIIKDNYKYIFNKKSKKEMLFDVFNDIHEDRDLIIKYKYDHNRHKIIYLNEVSFYPYEEKAFEYLNYFREIKRSIWKTGGYWEEKKDIIKMTLLRPKLYYLKLKEERLMRIKKEEYDGETYEWE